MQNIYCSSEPNRIYSPVRVAIVTRDDLKYICPEPFERLDVPVSESNLGLMQSKTDLVLHCSGEFLQVSLACSDPFDRFCHLYALADYSGSPILLQVASQRENFITTG